MSVPGEVPWESLRGPFVVVVAVVSTLLVARLTPDGARSWGVRSRFLHGVPWGTLLTVVFVLGVYLFVQGGLNHPRQPLVIPFRSWSYYYPLGMVTAAFSHSSLGHLLGNLTGTIAYATVAEYVWGHYPRRRGVQTFTAPWTNPYVRILAVPAVSIAVGLFTSVFALGPVIGFSGVVFAYAGFALATRPILGVLAVFASQILSLGLSAVTNPRVVTSPQPRVTTPWWAEIAIQGHAIGLFAGLLLGVALVWKRDAWPDPRRLWFALVAYAAVQGLWAVYVPSDGGQFVLFRWVGVAVVFLLAAVVAYGVNPSPGFRIPALGTDRRMTALAVVVVVLGALAGSAVFYNVAPVADQDGPEPAVQVGDYSVGYAEDIQHGYAGAVTVPFLDSSPDIRTSGVIVTSERRHAWINEVHPAVLENRGRASVLVGGLGWRERVYVNRTGWTVSGGEDVYQVYLRPEGDERTLAFSSAPARADPVIAGHNLSIHPADEGFELVVSRENETRDAVAVPGPNETARAGGIAFTRNDSRLYASANQTRVPLAEREN